jgi:hypothetical protein
MTSFLKFEEARVSSKSLFSIFHFLGAVLVFSLLAPNALYAQSATSGLVTGVVLDPSNAAVAGSTVGLQQLGTTVVLSAVTDASGRYTFPSVPPGDYTLKVITKGFRNSVVTKLKVEVLQSYTVNVSLEIGVSSETVEVVASAEVQLQTTDSSIGNVLGGEGLERLPAYTRSASSLMFLQPGVTPPSQTTTGFSDTSGGAMAGARSEQITFNLDGGDATSDLEGSNNYVGPPGEPQPAPVVPVPQESTEEFRVSTSNPNATFGRSSGAQVALLTKHGANSFHGSAYEYHFDDGLGANSWTDDRLGIHKPHVVDNRFGATTGGPIWKDKLFFFVNYEGRRLYDESSFTRVVPTASLKSGIMQFCDNGGGLNTKTGLCSDGTQTLKFNFNPANGPLSSACGSAGTGACDPRGIGVSAVTMAQLALLPPGNNNTVGDNLNSTGFTFNIPTPTVEDIAVTRLDYKINSKWNMFGTWHWARGARVGNEQIQITGTPKSVSTDPFEPNLYTVQVSGQLSSNFTSSTHGSWLRNWWGWNRLPPSPQVSGTDSSLQLDGEGTGAYSGSSTAKLITDPYNVNTQQARARAWNGHDWYIAQDFSSVHGKNVFQFGGAGYIWHDYHLRTDNVLGGLTSGPIYFVQSNQQSQGSYFSPGSTYTPPSLASGDINRWDGLYATLLGIVDHSAQIETRSGTFNPNPLGTPLFDQVSIPSFYTYFQNVWQARPGLTITYGVDWGVQLTPSEANAKEVVWTYANSGAVLDYYQYIQNRASALNQGVTTTVNSTTGQVTAVNAFNPAWALTPVNSLASPFTGQMRHTDWSDFGPRASIAWQVPWKNKVFGDKGTVIRGGYALVYDRSSAVGEALNPLLTGGLADTDQCGGPIFVAGGVNCSGTPTTPTNAFRIGPDGSSVGVPAPNTLPIPFVPSTTAFLPQHLTSSLDPYATPGFAHSVDFSIQRALPGHMFLEVGYIGRFSRNLPQSFELNAPDYLMKDAKSGQTLAQAFDGLSVAVRSNTALASLPTQPFFENILGTANCVAASTAKQAFSNCSQFLVFGDKSDFANGSLGHFTTNELNPHLANFIDNMQVFEVSATSDGGWSNYNAGFVNLNKTLQNGLQFQLNWTWSHAIGIQGINQQYLYSVNSPYNLNLDKSSEPFDRKHTINFWWYYDLPFGRGAHYRSGSGIVDHVIGGWYTSGIYTFFTGLPLYIGADGDYGAYLLGNGTVAVPSSGLHGLEGRHDSSSLPNGVPNIFGDPTGVFAGLKRPLLSSNGQNAYDQLRMIPSWNVDLSVGKNILATERYKMVFSADFLNAFNHVLFVVPSLNMSSASTFGQLNTQLNNPRRVLAGLRFEF